MYIFLKNEYEERKANYISTLTNGWEKGYQSVIHHFKMVTDTIMFSLSNDDRLKEILLQVNNTRDIEAANKKLLNTYDELDIVNQANSVIRIFQVHDKQGNALVRFQKPEKYGDNVLTYLGVVIATHTNKAVTQGFEGGKYFNAYRFVYPIMEKGEFLGSVQLGFEEKALNEHMQEDFMVSSYLAVDAKKNKVCNKESAPSSLSIPDRKFVHHERAYQKEKQELIASFLKTNKRSLSRSYQEATS
jgi:hypothetical protein